MWILQTVIWGRLLAAVIGGAALGAAAVLRRTIITLKQNWNLADEVASQAMVPDAVAGQVMEMPLGDRRVRLQYRGNLSAHWEQLGDAGRQALIRRQGVAAWAGLVIFVLAVMPFGPRGSLFNAAAAAATGFLLLRLLNRTGLWTLAPAGRNPERVHDT